VLALVLLERCSTSSSLSISGFPISPDFSEGLAVIAAGLSWHRSGYGLASWPRRPREGRLRNFREGPIRHCRIELVRVSPSRPPLQIGVLLVRGIGENLQ
jgi:hypothetical protein